MNYCLQCHHIFQDETCPYCHSRKIRPVEDEDYCFLTYQQYIWAKMLEEYLDKSHIDYQYQKDMGSGLSLEAGPMLENYSFYVSYKDYYQTKNIVDNMFKTQSND